MAKRFKLKLSRVIPFFQTCRSNDASNLPSNPLFLRLSLVNHKPIAIPLSLPSQSLPTSNSHRSSSAFASMRYGFRPRSSATHHLSGSDSPKSQPQQEFLWKKEEKWHVVAKIFDESPRQKIYSSSVSGNDSNNDDVFLPPPPPPNTARKKRPVKKKIAAARIRISSTSSASGSDFFFSSEGFDCDDIEVIDDETETLVSSWRLFSSDSSSEVNPHLETFPEAPFPRKKKTRRRSTSRNGPKLATRNARKSSSGEQLSPARLSRFQWLIPCSVEGKVRESFAVVKNSEDPHEDFKRSMLEMIVEKQMFEEKDLEQLLNCFLYLNSKHHHAVIVQAFSEIWEALFCT